MEMRPGPYEQNVYFPSALITVLLLWKKHYDQGNSFKKAFNWVLLTVSES